MNEDQIDEFKLWANAQPDYISYKQARSFMADYLGVNDAKAEIALAKLQQEEEIKIVKNYKDSGKRIFIRPLEDVTEETIRSVWDGSPNAEHSAETIARSVHDQTGYDVEQIHEFLKKLDEEGKAHYSGEHFRWAHQ